jgi:DNA-binding winged helix-turn-helix (wHTH) protein
MRVHFGTFVLDPDTRELLSGDAPVPLSPKAFDLLALLVAHRPKALAKSDLQDLLWPNTFVVEKNLVNLISEIREALGDDPSTPRFIRTVHRFGYAFRDALQAAGHGPRTRAGGGAVCVVRWTGGHVRLDEGEHILGRDPDVQILLDSPGVSRRHARLTVSAGRATIEDLGSKNGTFVGDSRVEGAWSLGDGDTFTVGSVRLTFSMLEPPGSTETAAR